MKITCDQCAARYSVGDDKISGRTFKIRCKRCSHVIVVRGEVQPPAAEPAPADVWYAILDGAQQGPWELAELKRRRDAGDLDGATLVWREGLADWQAYAQVPELMPREQVIVAAPAPPAEDVQPARSNALLAERNETSVLFTLGNLARLAAPQPAAAAQTPKGAAQGEGSGLIDIQLLARSMAPAAPARTSYAVGGPDDLPAYAPVGFVEPAVLVPAKRTRGDRKLVVALGASVGLLAIVAVILIVLVLRRDGSTSTAEAAQPAPARAEGVIAQTEVPEAKPEVKPEAKPEVKPEAKPEVKPEAKPEVKPEAKPEVKPATPARPTTPTTPTRPTTRVTPTTPTTPATPTRPTTPTGAAPSEVECIMNDFKDERCAPYREGKKRPTPPTPGNLPEQLTRAAITQGLGTISVAGCSGRSSAHGEVKVSIKVTPEGRVSAVTIKESPDAALSTCVSQAAQRGMFPKTQRGGSFFYVWRL